MVRVVSLSDHPAVMLRDAQQRRVAAGGVPGWRIRMCWLYTASASPTPGPRGIRPGPSTTGARGCAASLPSGGCAARLLPPRRRRADPRIEAKLAAGIEGERLVEDALGLALDDEWALLRGYRNRGGEIDHLLIGPRGVFAIEGKHRNATIDCDGDRWVATKYDRYREPSR